MDTQKEKLLERIRQELRKLRGQNRFRGSEIFLYEKGEVRLPLEFRGSKIRKEYFRIVLGETESDLKAELVPGDEVLRLSEFEMDLGRFMEAVVNRCRGEDYLETKPKVAEYRKIEGNGKV